MQEKFLVEDIQPGLLDKTSMSDVFVNDSFPEKYLEVAHFSDTSDIKLPTIQNLVGTVEGNLTTNEKPDFYTNVFKKVGDNLKLKDPTYKNPIYSIDTINPENVLPYIKQDTNYSSNISAAFGQGGKGLVLGATAGAGTGAVATPEFLGLGAIPGSVIGGTIGGVSGFLSGLLNTSGKQDFIIGSNNRQRTAEEQSGFWNRVGGFTNNVIDRSFEAGLGGTAALLSTPFGALAGKDMYDWGDNPLTARLSKGLEESEYKAKLSDNYLSKGPIAKLFTGEGFQNEMADMVGFTVGMMVGTKGLGLLNKGAGILTAPAVEALGFEQKALSMASGEGMLGQVLPTLAKQSSSYFTRGTRLATEGAAAYDEALMFQGWRKGISNTYNAFKTEGVAGGLSNVGKGFTQFPTKFVNFFKDGTNSLNALSAFERTALASYGEARVESAQSYKDIYETALKLGYTGNEAANMATEGANRTLGFNMLLLGMTNQFGLNNIFKSRNVLPDLAKWLTKDYAFDNSTKLFLKNTLKSVGKNMGKGFVIEGFAEELGQFAIGEGSKNYTLDTNNPVYKSFLKEIVNAYTEGITSDEGISNWFGGGLFGAITGMIGLDGGLLGSFRERKDAKNFEVPLSIRTKMTETNEAIMDIMRHTSAFNGQLYNSYSRDEQGNLVKNNQGNERLVKSPSTVIQLAKALESISTLTKDQVASIVDATSLDELVKNATPQEKKSLENGFNGITAYLDHIDSIKESTDGVAQGFIEFVDKLNTTQRNDVMQTLYALKTSSLTEKAKSAQDIMKQQLLSNYVYDHVSNGVESKLFDELTLLEKTIQDPNANIQDLEFLGKKYQQEEKEQALADIKKQRKDINRQVNIYRNLQLRFGQPLSYEYLRDKEGNIEKHAITVPLKEVFRSAVRQIQIQESLKESKNTLDKELQKIVSVFGENEVLRQLNKGLSGSLENDILAEEILKNANVDYQTKVTLERIKENEDFLNFNLKYENAIFSKLTDAKSIIKNIHNRFKTLQNAIDEKEKIKEEEERLTALKKEEAERKAKAELEEAERKAKEQAEFEEKQRKDKERGVKEAQLKKEREEREAKLKKDQEEKEAQLKKQQEAEDLKKKKKEKERIVNELNRLIPDGFNIKVIGIDDFNVLTFKTKDGEIINSTIEEFENILKKSNQFNKYTLEEQQEEALENLKEIFKENAFLYDEKELSNVDINKFNTTAVDLYNVAKNILTEQELNKVLEKLSISDVNNLPLNKAIELSLGLKGVLLSRENISDKVDLARGFSDKSNYDYLINNIPFNNKFIIVTEDSLKRDQDIRNFIHKFVKKLKDNNVGGISNVAYEGFIIQVDYGIEKPNTEQLLSSLLNQVNEALVQFGNPKLNTEQYKVSIETYNKGNKEVSYQVVYQDKYKPIDSSNQIIDIFNLTLPEDLESILFNYTIEVRSNKKLIIAPNNSINVDFNIAKKYGLPTKPNKYFHSNDNTLIVDLNQPVTSNQSEEKQKGNLVANSKSVQTKNINGVTSNTYVSLGEKEGVLKATFTGDRSDKIGKIITGASYTYDNVNEFESDYGVNLEEELPDGLDKNDITQIRLKEERAMTVDNGKDVQFITAVIVDNDGNASELSIPVNKRKFTLPQQPTTSTPKLTKEELKKSNPEFFNKDGNISIADMSNDTFIKFMSGVIFDIKIDEIRSNNSPYRVISDLFYGFGLMDNTSFSSFLISASEETKNYFKEIYNFYQNSTIDNRYRREMEEGLKKYGIQKQIDQINRRTPFKKIDSLSPDEYIKIKLGYAFLHQRYAENRVYSDLVFNPATNQTLFRIPSKQVLDDLNKIIEILKNSQVFKYSEIKEDFLKLENFKNLSEEELIDLYNTKNLTLDNFNSVKNESTVEKQPVTTTSDIEAKKAEIEKRRQEELNKTQKFTINRANKDLEFAPEIELSEIDLEKSGLDLQNEEVKRVKVLEYRGKNSEGQRVGTVRIETNDGVETFEVFFNDTKINAKYDAELEALEQQTSINLVPVSSKEGIEILRNFDSKINNYRILTEYNEELDRALGILNKRSIAAKNKIANEFNTGIVFKNSDLRDDESYSKKFELVEKIIQDTIRKKYEPLFEKSSVDFFTVGKKNSNISVENITDFESVSISLLLSKNDITNVKLIEIVSPYKGIIEFSLKEGETTTAPVIFKKPHEQKEFIKTINNTINENNLSIKGLSSEIAWQKAVARKYSQDGRLKTANKLQEELDSKIEAIGKIRNNLVSQFYDALGIVPDSSLNSNLVEFKDKPKELTALGEGGLSDEESEIPTYENFVKDDNSLPLLTLENLRRTPGFDNRDKGKTEQELENEIASLRAKEQEEIKETIPDIDDFKINGVVNRDFLSKENLAKYNKIYDKYNKIILPLITDLSILKANLHSKAMRAFYELTQTADKDDFEFVAKRAGNIDVTKELYTVWTSQGYLPKPDDVVLLLVDKKTKQPVRFNGSLAYNFLPTLSQFYNSDGSIKNDEDLITALLQPKSSSYYAFRFDSILVNKEKSEEEVREAIRLNYLITLKEGLKERDNFIKLIKEAKDGVLVVPIEEYKEGIRPKLQGGSKTAMLGSLVDKNDKDLEIERPTKDTKGITRVFYKGEEVIVHRNALDSKDIKYLSELIYDYIKDEIPTNLSESEIEELEKKKKDKKAEIEKLVYFQSIKRNMNSKELSNNAISIDGKTLYRGPLNNIVIDTQSKPEALEQIKNLLSGNGVRAIAYHVNRQLLSSNQAIQISGVEYSSYEDFLKTKVLRVNYDYRINAIYARQAILAYPKIGNSPNTISSNASGEITITKKDIENELAKFKKPTATEDSYINDVKNNIDLIIEYLKATPEEESSPKFASTADRPSIKLFVFRYLQLTDNRYDKELAPFKQNFAQAVKEFKESVTILRKDTTEPSPVITTEEKVTKKDKTEKTEATVDPEDKAKKLKAESLAKRKSKGRGAKRAITRSESDSYIRENIEEFRTWLQEVLPQFPVETTKDVIDGIAEGMFYKNVITLWELAEVGTGFHEAFEGVWNSLLNKEQKDELLNEFKQREGSFKYPFSSEILNYSQATDSQIKETIAEEFRQFMLDRKLLNKQPIKNNFFLRLWNYIKDFINSLTNKEIREISKIENLFNEISKGKFKYHNTLSVYSEKEYRLIKEDETYDMSNTVLQTIKSKVFEIFSNTNEDVLLLNKENKDLYNAKLEQIRQELLNYETASAHAKEIKDLYLSEEGFKNYVIPHLSQHLASFKIQIESVEQDENNRDKEGFVESMFIDSKNLVTGSIKTMVHTLIDREYDPTSEQYINRYSIYDYFGDINTFVDGHKVINILQNVLANTPSRVIKDGVSLDAIDLFKIKLESFKNKDGIYPRGYEWIPEFLERVQKNDDLKLAVEKSFVTTKVENSKLYLKNNEIIDLDPVQDETITNQKYKYLDYFKAKYNVDNEIETKVALPNISGKRQNDTFNNLLDFLGIPKDEFNRAKETNPNLYGEYQVNMIDGYLKLKEEKGEALVSVQDIDNFYNTFKGISSTFKNLLLLNQDQNERQLVYQNADGKKQYSIMNNTTWSTLINVLNLVNTKQDLLDTLPHLANKEGTDFKESLQNSKILNGLFYSKSSEEDKQSNVTYNKGDKKPQGIIDNLKYTLINGVDVDGNEGMVTASLNDVDRVIQQVYYANKGIFYTMVNSDKSSELAINIGQFFGNHQNKTEGEFAEYLWNNYAENQLKFYNTYLSDKTNTNYDHFSKALKSGDLFWGKVVMTDGLIDIEASKEKVLENLRVSLSGFLKDFRDNANETDLYGIVQSSNGNLAKKIVYNTLLSTIEQHLIIYGDTLFYKLKDGILDSPKRTSAYNATKEAILQSQTHWNALYNKTMRLVPKENNGKFNVESFDDIEVMIQPEKLNAMVYDAYLSIKESHNQDLTEDQIALMLGVDFKFEDGKFVVTNYKTEGYVKAYLEMNEADAQAYILTDFYMDLMYRSGKLNQEQVDSLNWKKAKEIEIRSNLDKENPLYKEYSVMHRYWAKNILENMPNNNEAVIGVLKPQYSGYSENDTLLVPALLKNSVMPLHFIDLYDEKTNTVRYTKAMKAYINAQNNGTDIIGHKSGQKFGSPVDENGKFVPMFKEGEYNDESPIQQTMYESFMGIQSEIPAKRKFEILGGSQIRKIITQNLQALADSGNHPELVQLLQEYNEIVEARYNIGLKELEKKLGLTYVNNKYVIENPSKLVDQLKDELNRLNLPDNVKEIIDLNRDRTNLLYKLEGSPNNLSLQSVLLSIVDKTLVHQKVRGKGSPQIASSLFTNDTRSTEKVTINGKEREVMTDSGLGFYYNAEGEAIGMEVLIPNPFYDIYPDLTWEQFEVMMEKDPRLKELAAYRIPTQSLGQFEFIKIKGFYDNSLGDAVIVPSGIVAKAGSDFDIDKLNIYIPHVRLTEDNQLEYIEYLDDSNSTIEERYRKYALARVYEEYSNTINEWFNSIKQSNNELNETYNNLQDVKKENSLTRETFNTLPDIYKKAFWDRNAELDEFNIKGVAKIVDFRNLADRYIELLKDKKDSKSLAIKDKLSTMIVEYDRYLNIDKSIYENFNRIRESYIEEKESFMENKDFVLTSTMLDKGYISKEEFSQLPIPEQNTKKAIENRNIELMNKLATYKTNAFTAMSANNADTLKKLSELYKEKRTDTYLSIGSFMRQVNFRQANLSSKSLVGLAAVHVTGHMITQNGNTQLTGYFINSMGNKEELNIMLSMSYDNFLSLDKVWDTQGNLITSNLSEFLSAIVDAAKDPFVFDLNINSETLNTALYLTRLGVSLADTMRFMSSPIIKQYLKKKRINTSLFKKQINEISKGQALVLVETLNGTTYGNFKNMFGINNLTKLGKLLKDKNIYGDMFFKIGPFGIVYNMDTGLPVIDYNNYEQKLQYVYDSVLEYIGKDNIQNIDPYTNDDLTKTFVLLSYLKYNQQAGYLGNINAATSIDTKAPNTVSISVDLQMKRDSIKKDGFVYNTEDMFTNTFLDTLWKNKEVGLQALSNYQIMADPLFQENYLKPALTVLNRDKYLSTAKKDQIINKFQNFLMTYFLQNYDFENGSINNRKDAIKRDVINNYNEVLELGEEFKIYKLITKNKVKGNEFENIVKLRSNVNTSDINEAVEELLEYQELFKDSEDQEDRYNAQLVNDFLISLTEYSLLQTGFGPSRISFASYLPLQTYTKYLNEAFEDLYNNLSDKVENNTITQLWKLFIQNNSTDTLLADQIVDKENGDLGKNYFYSNGKLSKSFNTFDNYPLFVHRTYFDYDGRENKVLYQIASILEADNKLFIQYTPLDILGRGRYFTETVQKELTLKDNLLINIINSNKLEEVSIFESEMTETNSFGLNSSIKRLLVPIKTLITDFEPNVQKLFAEPTIELYNEVVGNYEYDLSTEGLTDSLIKDIETKLQDVKNSFEIINENNIVDTQIYSQLGSKTQSENIVFSNIKTNEGKYNRNANIKEAENNNRIYSMETSSDLSFSNPWAHFNRTGTIKTNTTVEAVKNYIDWLTTDKFNNVKPERKEWILNQLKSGELKNKPIQYYAELNEASHATALDYLINQYNWSTPTVTTEVKPGVEISSNATGLAAALTNPTEIAKSKGNLTQSYPVEFRGKTYKDAEAAYRALKPTATKDEGSNNTYNLMVDIITAKLQQHPRLVTEITKQGGSEWVLSSTHQPTNKNSVWETGGKNWFIKSLNEAYQNVLSIQSGLTQPSVQETQITYTPKGKATQTYTVRGSKIFNKAGKEVFTKDSIDRNKVFANVAVQQGRAVIVNYQDADYVVNTRNQIISVTTGKQMQWAENNGNRKDILSLALNKFNALNSTTKIPRNTVEGTKNECLK